MRANSILASMCLVFAAACGGGGGDDGDDAPAPDANVVAQSVTMVACSGGEPTVTTTTSAFVPSTTTISVGGRVRFMLGANHPLGSTTTGQSFSLAGGANACLRFAAAGTFTFRCTVHNFTGSVVVQ